MIRRKGIQIIALQGVVTGLSCVIAWGWNGNSAALSALAGGAANVLAVLVYVLRCRQVRGNTPDAYLQAQYAAQKLKFLVAMILFGASFSYLHDLWISVFFITYLAASLVYFAALLME